MKSTFLSRASTVRIRAADEAKWKVTLSYKDGADEKTVSYTVPAGSDGEARPKAVEKFKNAIGSKSYTIKSVERVNETAAD